MDKKLIKEQVLNAFNFRHACKEFDATKKISDDDFNFILETGRLSPSSLGLEPWKFLIIQNEDLRKQLKEVSWGAQGQLPTASHYVIFLTRNKNELSYNSQYVRDMFENVHHMPKEVANAIIEKMEDFQKNDAKVLDSERGIEDWSSKQCYIAMGNMMTSAAMIGIDSCPIEGYHRDSVEKILADANLLDKSKFTVACMTAFGYRKNEPKRAKTRQSMEEIVTFVK